MAQGLFNSSIGRKFAMALSAFFLITFLVVHLLVNFLSVISPSAYNEASHFMGTNPLVQFLFQPILIAGVVFHFVLGFVLEIKNKKARGPVGYVKSNSSQNSTWVSRNMVVTGAMILIFLGLHFADFWLPEINTKYIQGDMTGLLQGGDGDLRYYEELQHKFASPWRVAVYVIAFILLGLHLAHGFQSAFQSVGANHRRYTPVIKAFGKFYAIIIPLGFIFIAIYHFLNQ
ncbi:succinate dehydrogenase (or fumarate reductase) cytochrome b subunit, b558 family [Candidatus Ornithobacterium hominis]|uniref:succinate dehydrogenase cytochrome b subunit n=1 Tax=Candidatus Ornithobacterium hominis TaxID=2497989 RepID=UPI000E5B34AC|nr:succinate dehydrogenase cytochrome b subunit [Candidatus Ornithobacterium hominis]SZD72785.1 succinate dehydrogenase (or fumarate reductase) cytochrome b subunit, b558 family [Candidatus Ornithobacterium hominis]